MIVLESHKRQPTEKKGPEPPPRAFPHSIARRGYFVSPDAFPCIFTSTLSSSLSEA